MMRTTPCLNCPARTVGCHSTCAKYKVFREDQDRWNQARLQAVDVTEAAINGARRVARSLRQGGTRRRTR